MQNSEQVCKNCGHLFSGNFCNSCGEKLYTKKDKSVKHIFTEGFHFITHFEGKFFTTIKTVFTRPGKFSVDYCNGLRKKYFKPVSLFLLIVVLYLLFPRFSGLNMRLNTYATDKYDFTWASVPLIEAKKKALNLEYTDIANRYDAKSPSISKIALFLLIPLSSLLLLLLFYKTKKPYFDHFILSLELSAIFIALHFLVIPFISFLATLINEKWMQFFMDDNYWLLYSLVLFDLVIASMAFKRFYQQKWIWTVPKAIIYLFIFNVAIIYLYRLLVLVVTLILI